MEPTAQMGCGHRQVHGVGPSNSLLRQWFLRNGNEYKTENGRMRKIKICLQNRERSNA